MTISRQAKAAAIARAVRTARAAKRADSRVVGSSYFRGAAGAGPEPKTAGGAVVPEGAGTVLPPGAGSGIELRG
jgi:hypothetical protein